MGEREAGLAGAQPCRTRAGTTRAGRMRASTGRPSASGGGGGASGEAIEACHAGTVRTPPRTGPVEPIRRGAEAPITASPTPASERRKRGASDGAPRPRGCAAGHGPACTARASAFARVGPLRPGSRASRIPASVSCGARLRAARGRGRRPPGPTGSEVGPPDVVRPAPVHSGEGAGEVRHRDLAHTGRRGMSAPHRACRSGRPAGVVHEQHRGGHGPPIPLVRGGRHDHIGRAHVGGGVHAGNDRGLGADERGRVGRFDGAPKQEGGARL